jgi:hypothetical protein
VCHILTQEPTSIVNRQLWDAICGHKDWHLSVVTRHSQPSWLVQGPPKANLRALICQSCGQTCSCHIAHQRRRQFSRLTHISTIKSLKTTSQTTSIVRTNVIAQSLPMTHRSIGPQDSRALCTKTPMSTTVVIIQAVKLNRFKILMARRWV